MTSSESYSEPRSRFFDEAAGFADPRMWRMGPPLPMVLIGVALAAFIFPPLGLLLLAVFLFKFSGAGRGYRRHAYSGFSGACGRGRATGNSAFDAYRRDEYQRLRSEERAFHDFTKAQQDARDKAEFDQFRSELNKES